MWVKPWSSRRVTHCTVLFKLLEMHTLYTRHRDNIRRPYGALSTRTETVSSSYGLRTGAVHAAVDEKFLTGAVRCLEIIM